MFQGKPNEKQNRNNHRKSASLDMEPLEPRRCLSADLPLFMPTPLSSFPSSTQQQSSQNNHDHQNHEHCDHGHQDQNQQQPDQTDQGTGCQCADCVSAGTQLEGHQHEHGAGCQCATCMGFDTGHNHNHNHGNGDGVLDADLPLEPQDLIDSDLERESSLIQSGQAGNLVPLADTFSLHSRPGANHTVFLDFDGHVTEGTRWNNSYGIDSIVSPAYDADGDNTTFNTTELERIQRIWQRVAEDFAPFEINVTTEDPGVAALSKSNAGDSTWGTRVIVTVDDWANCGCGGFAYIGSFNDDIDTPVFVFNGGETGVSEAASHEVGHAIYLSHDGKTDGTSYYRGHGADGTEEEWAPLMGVGYYTNMTTWDNGTYFEANNGGSNANYNRGPSDLDVITSNNGFGFRADDHGNAVGDSSALLITGENDSDPMLLDVDSFGVISQPTDVDMFSFSTGEGRINLDIESYVAETHVSQGDGTYEISYETTPINNKGSNLDVVATLYDANGDVIAVSNPSGLSAAFSNLFLTEGDYYISIDGASFGDWTDNPPTGYTDYVSLGQFQITGTIVVLDPNTPPIANNDFAVAIEDDSVIISPLTNDSDPDGDTLSLFSFTQADYGTVVSNGDGTVTYTPNSDFNGTDSFSYTVSDGGTGRADAEVEITVQPVADIDIQAVDADMFEGDTGFTAFTFEILLDDPAVTSTSVDWAVTASSDTDANDFGGILPSGVATFSTGQSSQIISIDVRGDTQGEFDESFTVELTANSAGIIRTNVAFGNIRNDDFCGTNIALIDDQIFINGTNRADVARIHLIDTMTVQAELVGLAACNFAIADVNSVMFHGNDGNDTFSNNTSITSTAYGNAGNDQFFGGPGVDISWGGTGLDIFSSSGGTDYAYGEGGDDTFTINPGDTIASLFVNFGTGNNTLVNNYGEVDFPANIQYIDGFNHVYDPATQTLTSEQVTHTGETVTFSNDGLRGSFEITATGTVALGPVADLNITMLGFTEDDLNLQLDNPLTGNLNVDLSSGVRDFSLTGDSNVIGGDLSIIAGEGYFTQTVNLAVNHELSVDGTGLIDLGFHSDTVNMNGNKVSLTDSLQLTRVNSLVNDGQLNIDGDLNFDVSGEIELSQLIDNAMMAVTGNLNYFGSAVGDQVSLNTNTSIGGNILVNAGDGNNQADLVGVFGGMDIKYIGGNLVDTVKFGTTGNPAHVNIKTKLGDDSVVLKSQANISPDLFRVDFGGGDDTFTSQYGQFDFNASLLNLDGFNAFFDLSSSNLNVVQIDYTGDVTLDNNGPDMAIRFGNESMNTLTPANDLKMILAEGSATNLTADFDNPRFGNTVLQLRGGDRELNFTGDSNRYVGLLRVEASDGVQTVDVAANTNLDVDGTFIFNGRLGSDELQATNAVAVSGAMLLRGVNTFVNNAGVDVGGDFNVITFAENEDTRLVSNTSFRVGGNLSYLGGAGTDAVNFKSTGANIGGFTYIDLADSSDQIQKQRVALTGGFSTDKLVVDSGVSLAGNYFTTDQNTWVMDDVIVNFAATSVANTANFFGTYLGTYGTYRGGDGSDFVTFGAQGQDMLFAALMGYGDDRFIIESLADLDFLYIDFGYGDDTLDNRIGDPLPFDFNFINL